MSAHKYLHVNCKVRVFGKLQGTYLQTERCETLTTARLFNTCLLLAFAFNLKGGDSEATHGCGIRQQSRNDLSNSNSRILSFIHGLGCKWNWVGCWQTCHTTQVPRSRTAMWVWERLWPSGASKWMEFALVSCLKEFIFLYFLWHNTSSAVIIYIICICIYTYWSVVDIYDWPASRIKKASSAGLTCIIYKYNRLTQLLAELHTCMHIKVL